MCARTLLAALVCLATACPTARSPRAAGEAPAPATAERAPEPASELAASEELDWDDHVGWEPRYHFAPGERWHTRPEGSYLVLDYALGPHFEALAAYSAGVALRDKPLVVRHADELCDPTLHDAVARLAPGRLLVHIEPDLDDHARDCLARLAVPDLYLSTCRHDGELPLVDRCTDGDAQLARIAASDELRDKVRGLAIGFGEETAWSDLSRFPRLAQLVLRGGALDQVDLRAAWGLCDLAELRYVDVLDAYHPGSELPFLPVPCIVRWASLSAWSLDRLNLWLESASEPPTLRCELERLSANRVEEQHRRALEAACPKLRALEVMVPLERCERPSAGEQMTCRPL